MASVASVNKPKSILRRPTSKQRQVSYEYDLFGPRPNEKKATISFQDELPRHEIGQLEEEGKRVKSKSKTSIRKGQRQIIQGEAKSYYKPRLSQKYEEYITNYLYDVYYDDLVKKFHEYFSKNESDLLAENIIEETIEEVLKQTPFISSNFPEYTGKQKEIYKQKKEEFKNLLKHIKPGIFQKERIRLEEISNLPILLKRDFPNNDYTEEQFQQYKDYINRRIKERKNQLKQLQPNFTNEDINYIKDQLSGIVLSGGQFYRLVLQSLL